MTRSLAGALSPRWRRHLLTGGVLLALGALPSATACDSADGPCTLLGCTSGILVHLETAPVGDFTVELSTVGPDQPPVLTGACPVGPAGCATDRIFPGVTATHVWVRVTTTGGTVLHEIDSVMYEEHRLNGPRCGVTCRTAEVTVGLP